MKPAPCTILDILCFDSSLPIKQFTLIIKKTRFEYVEFTIAAMIFLKIVLMVDGKEYDFSFVLSYWQIL